MNKLLGAIISSSLIIVISVILRLVWKKNTNSACSSNEIRNPKLFLLVGIGGLIFFNAIFLFTSFFALDPTMNWYEGLITLYTYGIPIFLLCIYLILISTNWKVIVYDDHAEYYNMFKKKYIFSFSEYEVKNYGASIRIVEQVKLKNKKTKYKCKVNVSTLCANCDILLDKYKAYKKSLKDADEKIS